MPVPPVLAKTVVPAMKKNTNLVLTRREDEEIVVVCPDGTRLVVRVASIRGDRVRIAMQAPTEYQVHRREVLEMIDEEKGQGKNQA